MKRTTILIVSLLITLAMALLILGSFHAQSLEQAIRLAESDFLWMVFFVRLYWGANLLFSRVIALLTVTGSCGLLFMVVTFLLNMSFPQKIDGVTR
ncbi:hypothetical protein J2R62_01585 [Plesiomonas shigelloides]|uniref:Uncharacterized protein n=1 Tax=Plesiomonas shigelloides TaxID=703 RepID=A0A8I1W6W5_PLESH|nr:hypothetical protein [Plesiomonas shigelloides]MBO1106924.1 hypothetical protein [Plesiomonas shigelloides]